MPEKMPNNNQQYTSVRDTVRKFNMLGKANDSSSVPIKSTKDIHSSSSISSTSRSTMSEYGLSANVIEQQSIRQISTATINLQYEKRPSINARSPSNTSRENKKAEFITYSLPVNISNAIQIPNNNNQHEDEINLESIQNQSKDTDDIGLEIIEPVKTRKQVNNNDDDHDSIEYRSSVIEHYGENDTQQQENSSPSVPPSRPPPPPPTVVSCVQEESNFQPKRSLPLANFLMEIGALVVVFILCMVLALAIREKESNLRITMQIIYMYIYLVAIIWMIWCSSDIIKFRQQWMKLTSSAHDQEEYMDIVESYPQNISYFLDIHNTGGLFMRVGAGLLCMGSLLLTVIELAKTMETMRSRPLTHNATSTDYSQPVFVVKSITYIFRFIFHCVQFTFLFRYGNIIINRYYLIARIGLIHLVIANLSTWFEAIVSETLEELHKNQGHEVSSTTVSHVSSTVITTSKSVEMTTDSTIYFGTTNFLGDMSIAAPLSSSNTSQNTTTSILEYLVKIESSLGVYLYPCLIEYSLISVTVFYIMWRNVGKNENRSFLHFGDRHIFTINCSRASRGLLIGGLIFLLTVLTLIPDYIVESSTAIPITHITEFVLLLVSLTIVCIAFFYTTKLYYDRQAHVDVFDQILILVTTFGDFAYSFFGLFATIFIESYTIRIPRGIEVGIGLLAILQTFLQSGFILDTLKRRSTTKSEIRKKPGREFITALLLINLAIWMHDSLSAKKVKLNPLQVEYYDGGTWSIIQAFTSPLSIFYRFHSSVCLADIWQEVYHDHGHHNTKIRPKENGVLHPSSIRNNIQHK